MFANLPYVCYAILPSTQETIIVKRGIDGYWRACDECQHVSVDELNARIGVTKGQSEAMLVGSMFGWDVEGANPANYNKDGKLIAKLL
jgi:hypothetical protein